jgi:hypothetical protein
MPDVLSSFVMPRGGVIEVAAAEAVATIRAARHWQSVNSGLESSVSVAFTKEDSVKTASETRLPDRPISLHPNRVPQAGRGAGREALK